MSRYLVNFVAFQAGWLACVLSAAAGRPSLGVLTAAAVILLHLYLATHVAAEVRLIALAAGIGVIFDSLLVMSGWVSYPSGMVATFAAPYWIPVMWALFATTLNVSLSWLKRSLGLAAVLGGLCGPLSYLAGAKLGGIELVALEPALLALAAGWAAALPLLAVAARRGEQERRLPASAAPLDRIVAKEPV
jgi:hypothetical protein